VRKKQYAQGDISMPVDFCCHLVGKNSEKCLSPIAMKNIDVKNVFSLFWSRFLTFFYFPNVFYLKKPFLIWLLTQPHLKYVATLPCNLLLIDYCAVPPPNAWSRFVILGRLHLIIIIIIILFAQ